MHHIPEVKITKAERERQKRAELKERRFQASIDFEIKDEVLQMDSPDAMEKVLEANRAKGSSYESYARATLEAADRWGRLMQVRMKKQHLKALTQELVDETYPYFGDWGVRAPMFLMPHWKYGEQLRKCLIARNERFQANLGLASSKKVQNIRRSKTRA